MENEKPLVNYEDWKGAVVGLYLSNGKKLANVLVLDLWMNPSAHPHSMKIQVPRMKRPVNIHFDKVMYYEVITAAPKSQDLQAV